MEVLYILGTFVLYAAVASGVYHGLKRWEVDEELAPPLATFWALLPIMLVGFALATAGVVLFKGLVLLWRWSFAAATNNDKLPVAKAHEKDVL